MEEPKKRLRSARVSKFKIIKGEFRRKLRPSFFKTVSCDHQNEIKMINLSRRRVGLNTVQWIAPSRRSRWSAKQCSLSIQPILAGVRYVSECVLRDAPRILWRVRGVVGECLHFCWYTGCTRAVHSHASSQRSQWYWVPRVSTSKSDHLCVSPKNISKDLKSMRELIQSVLVNNAVPLEIIWSAYQWHIEVRVGSKIAEATLAGESSRERHLHWSASGTGSTNSYTALQLVCTYPFVSLASL